MSPSTASLLLHYVLWTVLAHHHASFSHEEWCRASSQVSQSGPENLSELSWQCSPCGLSALIKLTEKHTEAWQRRCVREAQAKAHRLLKLNTMTGSRFFSLIILMIL